MILPNSEVYSLVGETTVRRAVVRPRNNGRVTQICLLPVTFSKSGVNGLRWDSIFLVPMNIQATKIAKCISSDCLNNDALVSIQLINPGDTLIIDNWKVLHGRTAIQSSDMTRRIERVYLKEIGSVS